MKNRIYFFTGTGNSLNVAQNIDAALPDCDLVAIVKDAVLEIPTEHERIGFVFPDYSGGLPKMVADFMRDMKLPDQRDTYLFAVATYAANVGNILAQVNELTKQKYWELNYGAAVRSYPNMVTAYPMIKGVKLFKKYPAEAPTASSKR
jgi:flavodoxin